MAIAVTCPQCRAGFEVPDDLADEPVRCHQCMHIFPVGARRSVDRPSANIHEGLPPVASVVSEEEETLAESAPPRRVRPRSPFPIVSVLVLAIGLLTFLLVASLGFNAWILLFHPGRAAQMEALRVEQQAQRMQVQAQQNLEMARQQQMQADLLKWQALQRENEDLKRQLEVMREQLDDAKRPAAKEEKKQQ